MRGVFCRNLANNALSGTIPPEYGDSASAFPGLLTLCVLCPLRTCFCPRATCSVRCHVRGLRLHPNRLLPPRARRQLQGNNLNGTLPRFGPGSWVSLSALNLTGNEFSNSSLPPAWGTATMGNLKYLHLADCGVSGAAPASLATRLELAPCGRSAAHSERCRARPGALPLSSILLLSSILYPAILCPLPATLLEWKSSSKLGSAGSAAGELPPSWGRSGAFGNLKALVLRMNDLQGGLPASWAQPASFASLNHLDVAGAVPAGAARAALCRVTCCCGASCFRGRICEEVCSGTHSHSALLV